MVSRARPRRSIAAWPTAGDQRPRHAQTDHPLSYTDANEAPLNLTNCCLSRFKQDTGEHSLSAKEINSIKISTTDRAGV